ADARGHYDNAELDLAIDSIDELVTTVLANRETIPAIWRPNGAAVNVLGELLAFSRSLRFSLVLQRSPLEANPFDVNRDGVVDVTDAFLVINQVFGGASSP
ncbi:MAG: hypothetical protein V3T72_10325, partial [Thermoanaerobaculia bacterium]